MYKHTSIPAKPFASVGISSPDAHLYQNLGGADIALTTTVFSGRNVLKPIIERLEALDDLQK